MTSRGALAVGIDVGGTKIAAGIVTSVGEVIDQIVVPTPADPGGSNIVLTVLAELVQRLRARHPRVVAVGVGAAGMVEWPEGLVRWAPNNTYQNLPLRKRLYELCGLPTIVDNDANTAAWAEFCFNVAPKHSNMLFLTVGTGVGGGIVLNGELYRGASGIASEVGHIIVDSAGGVRCGCGNIGCLEAVASGTALERMGRRAAAQYPEGILAQLAGSPKQVTGRTILEAARCGDPIAQTLFEQLGDWLGVGIASLVSVFDFDIVVVGGGLAATEELLLAPARTSFERLVFGREYRRLPEIRLGRFGDEAGLVGAAALALEHSNKYADQFVRKVSHKQTAVKK